MITFKPFNLNFCANMELKKINFPPLNDKKNNGQNFTLPSIKHISAIPGLKESSYTDFLYRLLDRVNTRNLTILQMLSFSSYYNFQFLQVEHLDL